MSRFNILFLGFIFFSGFLQAKTLTWNECVQLAQQNNLELQIAENNVTVATDQQNVSRNGFLPHLSASASKNEIGLSGVTSDSYSAQLNLSQNLFAGFNDLTKYRLAELNLKKAQLQLQVAKAKLSSELKQNFETLLYAQANSELTEDIKRRRENNLRNVELRFNGGRENKGSVLLSRAYYTEAQYEDTQAEHQIAIAREQLARSLGINDVNLSLSGAAPMIIRPLAEPNFAQLIEKIPDFQLNQTEEALARENVDSARVNFYPSLDLTGSYGKVDSIFFPNNERWSAGLTLTIPLFDGGRDYYSLKAASTQLNSASKNKVNLLLQLRIQLRQSYTQLLETEEKAKVDELFKNAAVLRADIARNKYNNGLMTFDDWDVIENDLISKQKTNLTSIRERAFSEANWEQVQGIGVIP